MLSPINEIVLGKESQSISDDIVRGIELLLNRREILWTLL